MANRRFIDFPIASTVGDSDIILIWQSGANKQTTKATFLSGLPENLDELNDVAISGLTNGQILRYDSVTGKWENTDQGNLDLNDLNDVSIVSPSNGQVLVYNSSTSKWENSSGGYVPYTGAVTTVNLGAQTIQAGQFVKAGGTAAQFLKADGSVDSTAYGTGSVTSVALTMPSAFNVANSPITTAGTLAVTGAGTVGQYIRGDGSLADFPESSGGGSSVSYYLNGSISQGTIGGVAYKELNKVPILGAGTDFTINADGYIASFLTDAGDPNLLEIPGGNWNFETYFSASSGGGSPTFYVELYKYDGTTFTLIASSSSAPELIAFGTNLTPYFSTLAVPTTALTLTDRLAVRYYVTHSGRTITLHTENNHLCQVVTTFTTGLTSLNGLTAQVQNLAVGTSGTDFNIASATATHTFNLPTASATNRGALSSADWTTFNNKQNALTNPVTGTGASGQVAYFTGTSAISSESNLFWDATNDRLGIGNALPNAPLTVQSNSGGLAINLIGRNNAGIDESSILFSDFDSTTRNAAIQGTNSGLTFFYGPLTTLGVRLDGSGNVGINTATPTHRLTVENSADNTIFIVTTASGNIRHIFRTDSSQNAQIRTGNNVDLRLGVNEDAITIKNGGNVIVGINTFKLLNISDAGGAGWATTGGASTSPQLYLFGTGTSALVQTYINNVAKLEVSNSGISVNGSITSIGVNKNMILGSVVGATGYNFITLNSSLSDGLGIGLIGGATGDESLYINAGNGGNVVLRTGTGSTYNTRIIVYGASGNVGIGTPPASDNGAKLQVSGTANFVNTINPLILRSTNATTMWTEYYYNTSTLSGYIGSGTGLIGGANASDFIIRSEADLVFASSGGNRRLTIASTGAATFSSSVTVGNLKASATNTIGWVGHGGFESVSDGNFRLYNEARTVFGNLTAGAATFSSSVGIGGATNTLGFLEVWKSGSSIAQFSIGQNATYHTDFFVDTTGNFYLQPQGTTRLTITSSGNVGIGTTSPTDYGVSYRTLEFNAPSFPVFNMSSGGTRQFSIVSSTSESLLGTFTNTPLIFYTNSIPQMRITSGGSVGINNTSPVNTAWGNETTTKQLSIDATNYAVINLQGSTGRKYSMGVGDGNFYMCYDNTAARHNIVVSSGGNVLINTTTSGSSKLRIVGLPTSSAGLSSGDVWSDSGTLKIA